jgi:hypothetical protein
MTLSEHTLTHRVSVNYLYYDLRDDAQITVRWDHTAIRIFEAEFTVAQLRTLAGGALLQQSPASVVNLDELGELAISSEDVAAFLASQEPGARTVRTLAERDVNSIHLARGTAAHRD